MNDNEIVSLVSKHSKTSKVVKDWKPAKNISFETIALTNTKTNKKVRPAGFRSDGTFRQIKRTCLLS